MIDRELEYTQKRIRYNNEWQSNPIWDDGIVTVVKERMKAADIQQIFCPLHIQEDVATDYLYRTPDVNRSISVMLDSYDELPFRPDYAFDIIWRATELLMVKQAKFWKPKPEHIPDIISKTVSDVIIPSANKDAGIQQALENLIDAVPISALRFTFVRMFLESEMAVLPQLNKIKERCIETLGKDLYQAIDSKYICDDRKTQEMNVVKASQMLRILMRDGKVELLTKKFSLSLQERIDFILNGLIYTSRCERFHGDYFSPTKSDRSNLDVFYSYYWLFLFTYTLFWILTKKQCAVEIFKSNELGECISGTLEKMGKVFEKRR